MKKNQIQAKNNKFLPRAIPLPLNNEIEHLLETFQENSGVSVSEDDKSVYVEAALPGISPEEIEMSYDRGMLSIKADKKEETSDKKKKFYRKAHKSFFYQVAVPRTFDETKTPEAICKNGILKIVFAKRKTTPIKKG